MKENQFVTRIVCQGKRRTITIPTEKLAYFKQFESCDIKVTIEEI